MAFHKRICRVCRKPTDTPRSVCDSCLKVAAIFDRTREAHEEKRTKMRRLGKTRFYFERTGK